MRNCKCLHAYYKDKKMCDNLGLLLFLLVLSYANIYVEGALTIKKNLSTVDGIDDSNGKFSSINNAKITTRSREDNYAENKSSLSSFRTINPMLVSGTKIDSSDKSKKEKFAAFNKKRTFHNNPRDKIISKLVTSEQTNLTLCRCMPDASCWPSLDTWSTLNSSLGGVLLKPSPPASPCYEGPNQNATACMEAATNWVNPFWRANQVGAMQYVNKEAHGNQTCSLLSSPFFTSRSAQNPSSSQPSSANAGNGSLPTPHNLAATATATAAFPPSSAAASSCQQGAVPFYAIEVLKPSHAQSAVAFAAHNNLRLSIKSSGHDVLGRSTAPGSLNLWMHKMKNITFHDSFTPDGCDASETYSAVTADSGTQWQELYDAAQARNLVVVGAMSGSVSTGGGFVQGGGHSPLSPFLGLAADNIIEMKVVTADGRIRTANACQNRDLFWALRGGGGGTFGVVLSCTHITYPALESIVNVHIIAASSNATLFKELLTEFVYLQSSLSQGNFWAGYSYLGTSPILSLTINYLAPNCNISIAQASFAALLDFATAHSKQITLNVSMRNFPSFNSWHSEVLCSVNPGICSDVMGMNTAVASRLLPFDLLQQQPSQVAQALMEILGNGVRQIVGHLVGGQTVSTGQSRAAQERLRHKLDQRFLDTTINAGDRPEQSEPSEVTTTSAQNATMSSSVNPAFRKAVWHVVLANFWGEEDSYIEKLGNVTQMNGLLRELSPGSGCYLNEADVNEPNWQEAFFGDHYSRLKSIKSKLDPQGLFTCTNCVGSEEWTMKDQLLCRHPSSS